MTSMTVRRHTYGFTLMELIVVITLMGIATTLGMEILFKMSAVWHDTSTRAEQERQINDIFALIHRDITAMASVANSGTFTSSQEQARYDRFPDTPLPDGKMSFNVMDKTTDGQHKLIHVTYRVDRTPKGSALVRTANPVDNAINVTTNILTRNILALSIETCDRTLNTKWHPGWGVEASQPMPSAVRVSISLIDPNNPFNQISRKAVFPVYVD